MARSKKAKIYIVSSLGEDDIKTILHGLQLIKGGSDPKDQEYQSYLLDLKNRITFASSIELRLVGGADND